MKKIIEYAVVIVGDRDLHEFAEKVNVKIEQGFQPYGYPCTSAAASADADNHPQSDFMVVQAMVKYEDYNPLP